MTKYKLFIFYDELKWIYLKCKGVSSLLPVNSLILKAYKST